MPINHRGPGLPLQHFFQKVCGGGFAVGAGNANHGHLLRRVGKPVGAEQRQRPAAVGHFQPRLRILRRALAQNTNRAFFPCHGNKIVSVGCVAGHGNKQVPRRCFS